MTLAILMRTKEWLLAPAFVVVFVVVGGVFLFVFVCCCWLLLFFLGGGCFFVGLFLCSFSVTTCWLTDPCFALYVLKSFSPADSDSQTSRSVGRLARSA